MTTLTRGQIRIPWYSWVALVGMLGVGGLIVLLTNGRVVADWLRWTVTILWILYTVILGFIDFIAGGGSIRRTRLKLGAQGVVDSVPFDRWTISHGGAGLVFGVWYMPLLFVLGLVIAWEFFEYFVPGFGEKEIFANRLVDIGIAMVLWLVVVVIAMIATGAPFPFASPVMH